ncbi:MULTISPECIES: MaoC/PaaZ C-terminal domain-containing protein [Bacillaceae]|uniref:MaoC/PaaZ C-terminal domain-containing protein n=1 Tax=Metabacillus sediminis TaxID=3117746 RepID=A0ABZ2NDR6_9BACI|nr:MaoC/PaaZ C-terminal domain-containing protein [Bacillus sp. SJS]KZZ85854.1 enoyl-CoA hydratase [Bacillus sp. SJS]
MVLGKKRKIGRPIEEINTGEKLTLTEKMEDKDLLLYLGLTNDANPLYIQHDYASLTPFKKPVVPTIMLSGFITSAISKYLPGPGSHVTKQHLDFHLPVYHYEVIQFFFEVKDVDAEQGRIRISVEAFNDAEKLAASGILEVIPPIYSETQDGQAFENF